MHSYLRGWGPVLVTGVVIACSTADPLRESDKASDSGPDTNISIGTIDDAGDFLDPDEGPPIEASDAGPEEDAAPLPDGGDAGTVVACTPVSTFKPATGATGTVCNSNNVLSGQAGAAGLDYSSTTQLIGMLDGKNVTACIGVDFPTPLSRAAVRLASTSKACNTACVGADCGTGRTATVFAGEGTTFKYLGSVALTPTAATFNFNIPAAMKAHRIVVCRAGWRGTRDDVNVYGISGFCAPGG